MLKAMTWVFPTIQRHFRFSVLAVTLASLGVISGCATTQGATGGQKQQADDGLLDADSLGSLEDLLYATDMRAVESDRLLILRYGDVWKRITVGFKMNLDVSDPRIDAQRSWFISRQPYLDRLSARASRYLYYTVKEAEKRGLPTELALLPVIESSYDPAATSSAAAAGLWQFIPSTGRIYGLRQSSLYDGRRDVVESTRAAYEYLSSLYNQFGSWELALAAYNAGPGRIQQAINRNSAAGLPTDYWSLRLPAETMNYVPRFLAVAQIVKNPERYGVHLQSIANRPHFREVSIPGSINLDELSQLTGVSRGELYALNPGHRGNYTDPLAPARILIPNDVSANLDAKINRMNVAVPIADSGINTVPPTVPTLTVSTTVSSATNGGNLTVTRQQPPSLANTPPKDKPTVTAKDSGKSTAKVATPQGSQALATFAANADVPSAPRIPVSVQTAQNIKPIPVESPISEAERQQILKDLAAQEQQQQGKGNTGSAITAITATTAETAAEVAADAVDNAPIATAAETAQVVAELKEIAPAGTEIVDPLDGKIKLTAIQSSQSIAEQKGEEVTINYAYPKAVTEAEQKSHSDAIARNAGKPVVETKDEVVVVAPKGKRDVYTVQSGDTLANIAMRFGVSWRDIAHWNQIDPEAPLFVGTRLYLYNAKPQPVAKAKEPVTSYTVQAGDFLSQIAQQYNVNLQDLVAWNNLSDPSNIFVGQKLTLVEPKNFKAQQKTAQKSQIPTETYVVKRGEYLQQIAARYDMSTAELAALNDDLSPTDNLLVGQKIQVPKSQNTNSKTVSSNKNNKIKTATYTVEAGDYLSSVAAKYNISLNELAALNDIDINNPIMVGQKLKVPATATTDSKDDKPETYVTKRGDNLAGVAKKFGMTTRELAAINKMKTTAKLSPGTILNLTETSRSNAKNDSKTGGKKADNQDNRSNKSAYKGETESYKVKAGESLTAIAARYQLSVNDLAALNGLNSRSGLYVGQNLQVPKLTISYVVRSGDNLNKIARRFGISVQELADMNQLKANTKVRKGQVLTVPNKQ